MGDTTRRRLPLRVGALLALVLALAATAATTWAVRATLDDQGRRLLRERSAEVGLVFTSAINALQTGLEQQGAVLKATGGSVAAYREAATAAIAGSTATVTYGWLRPQGAGSFVVLAAAGSGLRSGDVVTGPRVATLQAAMHATQMVSTPVIGAQRVLGSALGGSAAPTGTVLYREQVLGPVVAPPRQASSAPFSELDVVLYATPKVEPTQVLVSTTRALPLRGNVRGVPLAAGASRWLLEVKARRPLVGGLTSEAQWLTLGAGLLGSLLIAAVVETAARRRDAALALWENEHQVAETLQRHLLPELPSLPGLDVAARYLAGGAGQRVGGDWFDVFPVTGDRVGVVVGDVIGHDLSAASAMAQIRAALRAYAVDGDAPATVIARLERLVQALSLTQLVTVVYGVLDAPASDGSRRLRYANAGHLPPMLLGRDGRVETLSGGTSVVIGAPITVEHAEDERVVPAGATLVMFTDGLVETPGTSLDDGLDRLAATISEGSGSDAEGVCEHVLASVSLQALRDDIALLAVRVTEPQPATVTAPQESVAVTAR